MALGNNKDYKTRSRIATNSLAKHFQRMQELVKAGMDRNEASKQAYQEMTVKSRQRTKEFAEKVGK